MQILPPILKILRYTIRPLQRMSTILKPSTVIVVAVIRDPGALY